MDFIFKILHQFLDIDNFLFFTFPVRYSLRGGESEVLYSFSQRKKKELKKAEREESKIIQLFSNTFPVGFACKVKTLLLPSLSLLFFTRAK